MKIFSLFFIIFVNFSCATTSNILSVKNNSLRPTVLYHGSQNRAISIIEPQEKGKRDPNEGPVVFAAIDPALASIFITPTYQHGLSGRFCSTCPYYFIFNDENKFKSLDKGGSIYFVPINSFITDPNKGLGTNEWVSQTKVKPLFKIDFDSSLQAMLNFGVQVYFVSAEVFGSIKESDDHGNSILLRLQSENKKHHINYFHLNNVENNEESL